MPTTDARPRLEFTDEFLRALNAEPTTKAAYRFALLAFAEFLVENSGLVVPLSQLEPDSLIQFQENLTHAAPQGAAAKEHKKSKYSERTSAQYLVGVLRFLEWLDANRRLPEGLSSTQMRLILKNACRRKRRYLQAPADPGGCAAHCRILGSAAGGARGYPKEGWPAVLRNHAMVHTLFATGLQAHELSKLKRKDCADGMEAKILIVGKGGKPRVVALDPKRRFPFKRILRRVTRRRTRTRSSTKVTSRFSFATTASRRNCILLRSRRSGRW
jgi:integrase